MIKDREKAIGVRVRQFREMLQIPRTKFSLTVGLTADQLSAYEFGRANVRYEVFSAISKRFKLNPHWLATGEGSATLNEPFDDSEFQAVIRPRMLFSEAWDGFRRAASSRQNQTLDIADLLMAVSRNLNILGRIAANDPSSNAGLDATIDFAADVAPFFQKNTADFLASQKMLKSLREAREARRERKSSQRSKKI